ncbi:MAG TPA: hypothetical protein VIH52_04815 [Candidatus Nanoarchaeia archaeon]|nr:hypothetical protein [uncultured archaeon]
MNVPLSILALLILVLVQTTLLPLNLSFAALVWYDLFVEKIAHWGWLLTVAALTSLLGNFNLGATVLALTFAFLLLELFSRFLPTNRITRGFLVILALPLAEAALLILGGFLL